jgi:hypothetical protein
MHRAFRALVLSAVTILGVLGFAPAGFAQNPQVTVSVFSDVPVSRDLLARAEQRAQEIFVNVDVDIAWIDCTLTAADNGPNPACRRSYGPDDLVLTITSHLSNATSDAAFGVAFLGSDGRGRYADVFWSRALQLDANSDASSRLGLDRILGSIMAHEMGHLLLGLNAHSVRGLMRAHWGIDELGRIDMGTLRFLPEQGKRMRARIANATSVLISSRAR